ncbi:MAG: universal stress protein [Herminiimonas sp.]|nr:universal stress protein [Herminiimonas sp.]
MFKTILVPTDGSPLAEKAAAAAIQFAKEGGAKIIAISVAEPHPSPLLSDSEFFGSTHPSSTTAHDLAKEFVQKLADAARIENVPCETIAIHSVRPDEEIIKAAKKYNSDLIFMGSHGHKGLTGLFVGSVTQKVLAHSPVPVLVYR